MQHPTLRCICVRARRSTPAVTDSIFNRAVGLSSNLIPRQISSGGESWCQDGTWQLITRIEYGWYSGNVELRLPNVERGSSVVECRTRNRESPGSNPICYRFEVWAFSFSSRCLSRLGCINEYLTIDSGGYVHVNSRCV